MNFGIIGYGRMGTLYNDVLSEMGFKINFICDPIQKSTSTTKYYQNFKEAMNESTVDGIIVSTYGPSHYEIVKYAIEKGIKYIVCEKPFTVSIKQADEIIEKLRKSDVRLEINYTRRFSDAYSKLHSELYERGIIGKPRSIIITSGAGGISTIGTHFFDLCSFILQSKVKSVYAVPIDRKIPNPRGKEFEDPGGYILLNFENDTRAYLDLGDDLGIQPMIEIIGEYGRVLIDDVNDMITIRSRSNEDKSKSMHLYGLPNPIIKNEKFGMGDMKELICRMITNLTSNSHLISTAEMAREKVEIYSAIRKSFATKEIVYLPLKDEYYEKEFMVT